MKVARDTRQRIENFKAEASEVRQRLQNIHIRLTEHAGTKRIARKLEDVIVRLEEWQKAA